MAKQLLNIDVTDASGLIATQIARHRECIAACERSMIDREKRGGVYLTADVEKFIDLVMRSSLDSINTLTRILEELNPAK